MIGFVRGCAVAALGVFFSAPALAYRTAGDTTMFKDTARVSWPSGVIHYVLQSDGAPGLGLDAVQPVIVNATAAWSQPECSAVQFDLRGVTDAHASPDDAVNTIEWLTSGWTERGYRSDAAGITDVQYERVGQGAWAIVEADMYLNAEFHQFAIGAKAADSKRDVLSVVTHEAGHMLGLLHPCETNGADEAPLCSSDASFIQTTMYPIYSAGEATLSPDDIAGACFLYPSASCDTAGCPVGMGCTPHGCQALCGAAPCEAGKLCVNDQCVDPAPTCGGETCPITCSVDGDCAPSQRCVTGVCESGTAPLGDPCTSAQDCESSACSSSGFCSPHCSADADCGAGLHCDSQGACTEVKKGYGATCSESNDCIGGQCLGGVGSTAVCTRLCGSQLPACASGWECTAVEGREVCVPPDNTMVPAGGCSYASPRQLRGVGNFSIFLLALTGLSGLAVRRRRRLERAIP